MHSMGSSTGSVCVWYVCVSLSPLFMCYRLQDGLQAILVLQELEKNIPETAVLHLNEHPLY